MTGTLCLPGCAASRKSSYEILPWFVKLCGWHSNSENKIFPAKEVIGNYHLKRSFLFIFISVILKKASQREL